MSNESVFTFLLSKNHDSYHVGRSFFWGEYAFSCSERTPVVSASDNKRELLILGLAVDVRNGEYISLAESIIKKTHTLTDVIEYEKYLGGKYLLFYREESYYYVIPDATASIPFCYSIMNCELVCSSNSEKISKVLKLLPDSDLLKIRYSGAISQAMPYDLTVYKEIKQLLPNHYFDFQTKEAYRIINANTPQKIISSNEAVTITAPFIRNITKFYAAKYDIFCPLTGGKDSRVVLSFLMSILEDKEEIKCYTIWHDNFTGTESDLFIPNELYKKEGFKYIQIKDVNLSGELIKKFDYELGGGRYSKNTLKIADTVHQYCKEGAILNGDIMGQIGKCSLHRDIPSVFATAGYFRCKLHNYSYSSKQALRKWIKEIKRSDEKVNIFDLFSIENRMGRWAAQSNTIYSELGQVNLNIFNSRSIIYEWTRVSRTSRKNSSLHVEFISLMYSELLSVPFGNDSGKLIALSKCNGIFYYVASYFKFWIEKARFIFFRE